MIRGSRIIQQEPVKEFALSLVRICNRPIIIARNVGKVETPAALIVTSQDDLAIAGRYSFTLILKNC